MTRNWDAEWEVLHKKERAAFAAMNEAQGKLAQIFADRGAANMALLADAQKKRDEWNVCIEAEKEFFRQYHAAHG